jgi:hypothetical protein
MKSVDIQLQKAHLTTIEHGALQAKLLAKSRRKINSRRSVYKEGAALTVDELREKIKTREEREMAEALQKARKKLSQTINTVPCKISFPRKGMKRASLYKVKLHTNYIWRAWYQTVLLTIFLYDTCMAHSDYQNSSTGG